MKRFKTYRVPHRRRREGRTDYRQRLRLLKSGKPRLVVRKSSNNLVCQIIAHEKAGDRTLVFSDRKDLLKAGWKAHTGNLPSAYLIGLLCGKKAKKKKINEAVLDTGLYPSTKGSSLYAALKGILDSGLKIPHSEGILPSKERISGKHIADFAQKLKTEKGNYEKIFSHYLKNKIPPEKIPEHFEEIRKKIVE